MKDLDLYRAHYDEIQAGLVACGLPFLYLSPLSILPRVSRGKMSLRRIENAILSEDGEGLCRVIPTTTDRSAYYQTVLDVLDAGHPLIMLPEYIAKHIKGAYIVSPGFKEYASTTDILAELPGKRLSRIRSYANNWSKVATLRCLSDHPELEGDFLACNALWYRQQTVMAKKFRLNDKLNIEWLIQNWSVVKEVDKNAVCLGAWVDGKIIGLNIACSLGPNWWGCFTRRHNMDLNNVAMFLFREVARRFQAAGVENLSDGAASTKELRQMKLRYASPSILSFRAERKGR